MMLMTFSLYLPVEDHETDFEYEGSDGDDTDRIEGDPRSDSRLMFSIFSVITICIYTFVREHAIAEFWPLWLFWWASNMCFSRTFYKSYI